MSAAPALYLFAQDSWKIKPILTLNYGLALGTRHAADRLRPPRADLPSRTELDCLSLRSDARPSKSILERALALTPAFCPRAWWFREIKGVPAGLTQTYYKAFAPRIGIA